MFYRSSSAYWSKYHIFVWCCTAQSQTVHLSLSFFLFFQKSEYIIDLIKILVIALIFWGWSSISPTLRFYNSGFSVGYVVDGIVIWKKNLLHPLLNGGKTLPHSIMLSFVNGMWEVTMLLSSEGFKCDLIPLALPFCLENAYIMHSGCPFSLGPWMWRYMHETEPKRSEPSGTCWHIKSARNMFVVASHWSLGVAFSAASWII